jgi:hypothetical protein
VKTIDEQGYKRFKKYVEMWMVKMIKELDKKFKDFEFIKF